MEMTVAELAGRLRAELSGDGSVSINAVAGVDSAGQTDVTFVAGGKFLAELASSQAGAVITSERIKGWDRPQLIVGDVEAALIEAMGVFAPKLKGPPDGVDPSAKLGTDVKLGNGVSVGAFAVIEDGVEIGDRSVIGNGCRIGENSRVGRDCRIDSNVVVYHNCTIGNSVIIAANTVIGSVGFGYVYIEGGHRLIPHNGGVIIEDFVEIGANCCVDRAKFGNTIIGAGTKMDNLVQIAHNVVIGKCCLIVGQVGISGSCRLGDGVILAGQVGMVDNVEIGDGTIVGAQSGVTHNIAANQRVVGSPAIDYAEQVKLIALWKRLPKISQQLRQLSKRVKALEAAKDDTD